MNDELSKLVERKNNIGGLSTDRTRLLRHVRACGNGSGKSFDELTRWQFGSSCSHSTIGQSPDYHLGCSWPILARGQ